MLMAKPAEPGGLAHLLAAPPLWEVEGLRRDRKLQRQTFRYKRELRQERIPICHDDDVEYWLRLRMALPLMNMESQNKRMLLRPMPLAQWCVSLALLRATASPALSFSQGTPEQHLACTLGVFRPCRCVHPQCDEITTWLSEKSAELSDACKAIEVGMKQLPSVSDGARKRTAR